MLRQLNQRMSCIATADFFNEIGPKPKYGALEHELDRSSMALGGRAIPPNVLVINNYPLIGHQFTETQNKSDLIRNMANRLINIRAQSAPFFSPR